MTHLVASELFKMRTTRTFYALMAACLALVLLPTILVGAFVSFSDATSRPRRCCSSAAASCRPSRC